MPPAWTLERAGEENDVVVVSFAYEREIHLAGPAYLTLKYEGKSR